MNHPATHVEQFEIGQAEVGRGDDEIAEPLLVCHGFRNTRNEQERNAGQDIAQGMSLARKERSNSWAFWCLLVHF